MKRCLYFAGVDNMYHVSVANWRSKSQDFPAHLQLLSLITVHAWRHWDTFQVIWLIRSSSQTYSWHISCSHWDWRWWWWRGGGDCKIECNQSSQSLQQLHSVENKHFTPITQYCSVLWSSILEPTELSSLVIHVSWSSFIKEKYLTMSMDHSLV